VRLENDNIMAIGPGDVFPVKSECHPPRLKS
jgi:hypothetical protein